MGLTHFEWSLVGLMRFFFPFNIKIEYSNLNYYLNYIMYAKMNINEERARPNSPNLTLNFKFTMGKLMHKFCILKKLRIKARVLT